MTQRRMTAEEFRRSIGLYKQDAVPPDTILSVGGRVTLQDGYSEADLSAACVKMLQAHGWSFPKDVHERTHSLSYSTEQQRKSKVTEGLPDLLIQHPKHRLLQGVELKTPSGKLSHEQRVSESFGAVIVWRTVQDCADWIASVKAC